MCFMAPPVSAENAVSVMPEDEEEVQVVVEQMPTYKAAWTRQVSATRGPGHACAESDTRSLLMHFQQPI